MEVIILLTVLGALNVASLRWSFGADVVIDTGTLNNRVPHPDDTTRLIPVPAVQCSA